MVNKPAKEACTVDSREATDLEEEGIESQHGSEDDDEITDIEV